MIRSLPVPSPVGADLGVRPGGSAPGGAPLRLMRTSPRGGSWAPFRL